jgi:hypothetical protein
MVLRKHVTTNPEDLDLNINCRENTVSLIRNIPRWVRGRERHDLTQAQVSNLKRICWN